MSHSMSKSMTASMTKFVSKSLALGASAAIVALGAALFAPTSASAFGHNGGGMHGGGHGGGYGGHPHSTGGGGHRVPNYHRFPQGHTHYPHRIPHRRIGFRHPGWIAAPVMAAPMIAVARPVAAAPGPCTCLSKEYTPEGRVLFKDRCTNEAAINPPIPTDAPVQQSSLAQPQADSGVYQTQPANMLPQQPVAAQ